MDETRRDLEREAISRYNWDWYQYRPSPSCPPDTSLYVSPGLGWEPPGWGGQAVIFRGYSFDLSDPDIWKWGSLEFSNPNWFIPATIGLWFGGPEDSLDDDPLVIFGIEPTAYWSPGLTEYETAIEAEDAIDTFVTSLIGQPAQAVLCQIIFRNNGVLTGQDVEAQIMPIDRVNRGRSYLYNMNTRQIYRA